MFFSSRSTGERIRIALILLMFIGMCVVLVAF